MEKAERWYQVTRACWWCGCAAENLLSGGNEERGAASGHVCPAHNLANIKVREACDWANRTV